MPQIKSIKSKSKRVLIKYNTFIEYYLGCIRTIQDHAHLPMLKPLVSFNEKKNQFVVEFSNKKDVLYIFFKNITKVNVDLDFLYVSGLPQHESKSLIDPVGDASQLVKEQFYTNIIYKLILDLHLNNINDVVKKQNHLETLKISNLRVWRLFTGIPEVNTPMPNRTNRQARVRLPEPRTIDFSREPIQNISQELTFRVEPLTILEEQLRMPAARIQEIQSQLLCASELLRQTDE